MVNILTVKEVAGLLRTSIPNVYNLITKHGLPAKKLGDRRIIIIESEFEDWLNGLEGIPGAIKRKSNIGLVQGGMG